MPELHLTRRVPFLLLVLLLCACGDDDGSSSPGNAADAGADKDSGVQHDMHDAGTTGLDAGPPGSASDADGGASEDDGGQVTAPMDAGAVPPALHCASDEMSCDGDCVPAIDPTLDDIHDRIIARTCALSGSCHTGISPKEKFDLTSADSMFTFVGKASKQMPSLKVIDPGKPAASYIIHKLRDMGIAKTSSTGADATRMPPPPTRPLCEEKIRVIETWIRAGAKR